MAGSLNNFQVRVQSAHIQCGGGLTDAATQGGNRLAV